MQHTRKSGANVLRPNELKNSMQLFKLIARFLGNVYARLLYETLQSYSGETSFDCLPLEKSPQPRTVQSPKNGVRLFAREQQRNPLNQTNLSRKVKALGISIVRFIRKTAHTVLIFCIPYPTFCQSEK